MYSSYSGFLFCRCCASSSADFVGYLKLVRSVIISSWSVKNTEINLSANLCGSFGGHKVIS